MSDRALFNKVILDILKQAGRISQELQSSVKPTVKIDNSVVTEADLRITEMAKEKLAPFLALDNHFLIDEESEADLPPPGDPFYKTIEYIWVLDPVDGTSPYAHGMPLYGTILGLLKNGKPWLGGNYMPALGELFLHDGERATYTKNPENRISKTQEILPITLPEPNDDSIYFIDPPFMNSMGPDNAPCIAMNPYTAVVFNTWPTIGRARGNTFRAKIWDFVGSWPVWEAAGFQFISMHTEKRATSIFDIEFDDH